MTACIKNTLGLICLSSLPSIVFREIAVRPLPLPGFEKMLKDFVDNVLIIDTHEHLVSDVNQGKKGVDFMLLLPDYAKTIDDNALKPYKLSI